jgi:hypothetical protein
MSALERPLGRAWETARCTRVWQFGHPRLVDRGDAARPIDRGLVRPSRAWPITTFSFAVRRIEREPLARLERVRSIVHISMLAASLIATRKKKH